MMPAMTRGGMPAPAVHLVRNPHGMTAALVSGATTAAAGTVGVRVIAAARPQGAGPLTKEQVTIGLAAAGPAAAVLVAAVLVAVVPVAAALLILMWRRADRPGLTCSRDDRSGERGEPRSRVTTGLQIPGRTGVAGSARLPRSSGAGSVSADRPEAGLAAEPAGPGVLARVRTAPARTAPARTARAQTERAAAFQGWPRPQRIPATTGTTGTTAMTAA